MQLFKQGDAAWKNEKIGGSDLTIGEYGCTLSGIAMLSTAFKTAQPMSPKEVATRKEWFTDKDHPQGAGLILWAKLAVRGLRWDARVREFSQMAVIAATLHPKRAALIEVAFPKGDKHWVVAVRWYPVLGWRVADPLTGTYRFMPSWYRPIGYALFTNT